MNILLVEDNNLDAMMIERALGKVAPVSVVHRAVDGIHALELISSGQVPYPFFVLLDINMPRMNGHEFLGELRASSQASDSMVFMFTTSDSAQDIAKAYSERVNGYIVKPQTKDGMKKIIETLQGFWTTCEPPLHMV
ncbi:response regulator [Thioclava sp. SK-1]|uniref:response regulator n=1 Tax=Thioclava sp. SK-1 TaxID=1889770 RepID=UPI002100D1BA|nr:response regulator [Thioclava sp. SK-1]